MADPWGNSRRDAPSDWRNRGHPPNIDDRWWIRDRDYGQGIDDVVTRPAGYVPYQSVVQPDGRYAYNPAQDYPRTVDEEMALGRRAQTTAERRQEFMRHRSDLYPHLGGEQVRMVVDYSRMRTQPMPAAGIPQPNVDAPQRGREGGHGRRLDPRLQDRPVLPPSPIPRPAAMQGMANQGPIRAPPAVLEPPLPPPQVPQVGIGDLARGVGSGPRARGAPYGNTYARGNGGNGTRRR